MAHAPLNPSEQKLRTALALLRAGQFLQHFKPKSNVTRTQWGSYLDGLFRDIYRQLFADTSKVIPEQRLAGALETSERAFELSEIFHEFSAKFYDQNGFFTTTDQMYNASLMAELYTQLERFDSFGRDTSLVLRVLFTALGRMRGFKEKLGGIDFRRLSDSHIDALMRNDKTTAEMTTVLLAAMNRGRSQSYRENTPAHLYWEDRSLTLYGKRFIQVLAAQTPIDWFHTPTTEPLVILVNGAVVAAETCHRLLHEHLQQGELLGSFRIPKAEWIGRLQHNSTDRKGRVIFDKSQVDGIDIRHGALPICMNLHPLSLLSHSQHERLEHYLNREFDASVLDLAQPELAEQVLHAVRGHGRAEKMVMLAVTQLQSSIPAIHQGIEEELLRFTKLNAHRNAAKAPELLMTMGGSGSGKGSNHYFQQHYTTIDGGIRDDFVYASLDEGRPYSDIYHILIAAGHHADDYEAVHLWADTRRNWLCEQARAQKLSVIYDGSGIVYSGRYDKIVKAFCDAGYDTKLIAADCMLIVPDARRDHYPLSALDRIKMRAGFSPDGTPLPARTDGGHYRTLPWRVALNKHIYFPSSLLAALADKHLGKIVLIDNAGRKGEDTVIAESFILADDEFQQLEFAQESGSIASTLRREKWLPHGHMASHIDAKNTSYLALRVSGMYHVMVIVNVERFVDVLEKAQLNPNAHGPSNLALKHSLYSFVVNRIDKPGSLDMTPPEVLAAYREAVKENTDSPRPNYIRLNAG